MALQRPILPAPGRPGDDRPPPAFTPPPKRQQTAVACEQCRKRKIKCDGSRPSCNNCSRKSTPCEYAADPGVGRASRNIARQEALERDKETLQTQNNQWLELITYIRTRPEAGALLIFQRLRQSRDNDPAEVLQMVQTGEVLAQLQQSPISRLEQINQEAWDASEFHASARPWTSVAGDGIVSELISLFLEWEAVYECPMVDKDSFLMGLRSNDPSSQYCSPILVNAICALACFLCDRIRELDGNAPGSLALKFLQAAEKEHERNNKPSLTSVQALYLMFMYGVATGKDKTYVGYRYTACSMIQTLNLERKYAAAARSLEPGSQQAHESLDDRINKAQAIAKGVWGLFCIDTIVGLAYGQPSLISPPNIPQPLGQTLIQIQCELSRCLNNVMHYSRRVVSGVGEMDDMIERSALYRALGAQADLLRSEREQDRSSAVTLHYLAELYHLSSIMLLKALLTCDTISPFDGLSDPRSACIDHCNSVVDGWRQFEKSHGFAVSSLWQVSTPATCCFMLVTQLGSPFDPRTPELFAACCAMLHVQASRWPLAVYWLQALQCFARTTLVMEHIPVQAMRYLEGLEKLGVDFTGDIPIGFIVPMQEELVELASDSDAPEVSIGKLIAKFNAASLLP